MKTDFDSACCNFWAMTDDWQKLLTPHLFYFSSSAVFCKTGKEKNLCQLYEKGYLHNACQKLHLFTLSFKEVSVLSWQEKLIIRRLKNPTELGNKKACLILFDSISPHFRFRRNEWGVSTVIKQIINTSYKVFCRKSRKQY